MTMAQGWILTGVFVGSLLFVVILVAVALLWGTQPRSGKDPMSLAWRVAGEALGLTFEPGRKIGVVSHTLEGELDGVQVVVTFSMRSEGRYQPGTPLTRFEVGSSVSEIEERFEAAALEATVRRLLGDSELQ